MNLLWYIGGLAMAIGVGWVAAMLHATGFAPIGVVSLGVGALLGITLCGLSAVMHVTCRTRLVTGTVVLAIVTVLAEHACLYGEFRRQWHAARANSAEAALFRSESPWTPPEYFAREFSIASAALWTFDGALITVAAAAAVLIVPRHVTIASNASGAVKSS